MKKILLALLIVLFLFLPVQATNTTTLGELVQDVRNNLLVMDDELFPDSVMWDFINAACRRVADRGVIQQLDTLVWVADSSRYPLPVDFLSFSSIIPDGIEGEVALELIRGKDAGDIAGATQLTTPTYVWITNRDTHADTSSIWFYPPPPSVDSVILVYGAEAIELIHADSITNIPYPYRECVVVYATGLCHAKAKSYQEASWWFVQFENLFEKQLMYDMRRGYDYIVTPKEIE